MNRFQMISTLLLLTTSHSAFAVCEKERAEREKFRSSFETASRVASGTCAAGSLATVFTFGASLIPCATAGGIAQNQHRILKEKENNLQACENENLRREQLLAQQELDKKKRVEYFQQHYNTKRDQIIRDFESKFQQIVTEFEIEGYDLTHPDIQLEIKEKQKELQKQLDLALEENELERNRALAGV